MSPLRFHLAQEVERLLQPVVTGKCYTEIARHGIKSDVAIISVNHSVHACGGMGKRTKRAVIALWRSEVTVEYHDRTTDALHFDYDDPALFDNIIEAVRRVCY